MSRFEQSGDPRRQRVDVLTDPPKRPVEIDLHGPPTKEGPIAGIQIDLGENPHEGTLVIDMNTQKDD